MVADQPRVAPAIHRGDVFAVRQNLGEADDGSPACDFGALADADAELYQRRVRTRYSRQGSSLRAWWVRDPGSGPQAGESVAPARSLATVPQASCQAEELASLRGEAGVALQRGQPFLSCRR